MEHSAARPLAPTPVFAPSHHYFSFQFLPSAFARLLKDLRAEAKRRAPAGSGPVLALPLEVILRGRTDGAEGSPLSLPATSPSP
jgi:hypothetical protein